MGLLKRLRLLELLAWWREQTPRYYDAATRTTNGDQMDVAELDLRKKLAPDLQAFCPNQSTCGRCGWPWTFIDPHTTEINERKGCFALCSKCWKELGSARYRMKYYRASWELYWQASDPWGVVEAAVLAEDPISEFTMVPSPGCE
jgi:bacterioferritin-associated ferredoxin